MQRFPGVSFGPHDGPDFLAGIACVEVIEQITKRGKIIVSLVAVHAVIDSDIPNIALSKETLGIVAHCHPGNAVVDEKRGIGETAVGCELHKDFLLIGNAVALAVQRVLL